MTVSPKLVENTRTAPDVAPTADGAARTTIWVAEALTISATLRPANVTSVKSAGSAESIRFVPLMTTAKLPVHDPLSGSIVSISPAGLYS